MKRAQFQELLDRYGTELTSWPPKDRAGAAELLSKDAEARHVLSLARRLDGLVKGGFDNQGFQEMADVAVSRVLSSLTSLPAQYTPDAAARFALPGIITLSAGSARWPGIAALAFAAALGVLIGYAGAEQQAREDSRRMNVAMEDMVSEVGPGLFEADSSLGAPK